MPYRKAKGTRTAYWCKHCRQRVVRKLNQVWIQSYCEKVQKTVRMMRIAQNG